MFNFKPAFDFRALGHSIQKEKEYRRLEPRTCGVCFKVLCSPSAVKRHVVQIHEKKAIHACMKCDEKFVHVKTRNNHMMKEHSWIPYKCPDCDKAFYSPSERLSHWAYTHDVAFQKFALSIAKRSN